MTGELRALLRCLLVDSALAPVRCVGRLARATRGDHRPVAQAPPTRRAHVSLQDPVSYPGMAAFELHATSSFKLLVGARNKGYRVSQDVVAPADAPGRWLAPLWPPPYAAEASAPSPLPSGLQRRSSPSLQNDCSA